MNTETFGIIGLGRMGGSLALLAMEKGCQVSGYDPHPRDDLRDAGLTYAADISTLVKNLPRPRKIFLWVPSGRAVDELAEKVALECEEGDVIIDGGNSYWGDSKRRAAQFLERHIYFLDLGTSGGVEGARHAPCFMIGGPRDGVALVEPLLLKLAITGGYVHAGESGAGHYVKLVHNGIEFGMLQALGEGLDLLAAFPDTLQIADTLECWRHGSVIRSWLIDLLTRAFKADPKLARASTYIEDTGEVNWLIGDAIAMDVAVPVIAQSVMMLIKSRDETQRSAKAVIEVRHEFGGHPYGKDAAVRAERETGRVGPPYHFSKKQK